MILKGDHWLVWLSFARFIFDLRILSIGVRFASGLDVSESIFSTAVIDRCFGSGVSNFVYSVYKVVKEYWRRESLMWKHCTFVSGSNGASSTGVLLLNSWPAVGSWTFSSLSSSWIPPMSWSGHFWPIWEIYTFLAEIDRFLDFFRFLLSVFFLCERQKTLWPLPNFGRPLTWTAVRLYSFFH